MFNDFHKGVNVKTLLYFLAIDVICVGEETLASIKAMMSITADNSPHDWLIRETLAPAKSTQRSTSVTEKY